MAEGARDLLRRLSGEFSGDEVTDGDSEEIDLRLSLGGCYNSLRDEENSRLIRSSSIPAMIQSDFTTVAHLVRSCSMPSEGEEIRRRKEMQSVKRMEAKRKREEKRNLKRFDEDLEGGGGKKMRRFEVEENGVESRRFGVVSQGSVASQGSSSSGESEFQSRQGQQGFEFPGIINASDVSIPSNAPTTSRHNNHKAPSVPTPSATPTSKYVNNTVLRHGTMFNKNFSRKNERERSLNGGKNYEHKNMTGETDNMMEEMPSVSTRGDGPNGRRIEGFLYRYGKGGVSIVCVCHGSFLTPAEFVKHAGGGDVAHPLRHIVVNPSPDSVL